MRAAAKTSTGTKASGTGAVRLSSEQVYAIARAIAEPTRFAMLQQIARTECTMCGQLDVQQTLSPATISHHLRELQEAGLIEGEREGRQMRLSLRRPVWKAYVQQLQDL